MNGTDIKYIKKMKNKKNFYKEYSLTDGDIQCNTYNYCQIVPMSFEEKVKMYMRFKKIDLARMLAERDELSKFTNPLPQPYPCPYPYSIPTTTPYYQPNPSNPFEPIITCCGKTDCASTSTKDYDDCRTYTYNTTRSDSYRKNNDILSKLKRM